MLEKLMKERRTQHGAVKRLEEKLRISKLARFSRQIRPRHRRAAPVVAAIEDASPEYLRLLAAKIVAGANAIALIVSRLTGHLAFAQSKGLKSDMGALLRETLKQFPGKGGGAKEFSQGSLANPADTESVLVHAKKLLGL